MTSAAAAPKVDHALVARLLGGEEAAFAELVERFHTHLIRLALVFVRDRSVAEEVVQDTWVAVIQGLPAFEKRSSLKTWIFRILANRARTRGTREARSTPFSAFGAGADDQGGELDPSRFNDHGSWASPPHRWDEEDPEKLLMRGETMAVLKRQLDLLPPNQRAAVVLRDVEGLESSDVCNILDVTETNLRVLLHRGRCRLRTVLEEHLGK